MRPYEVRWGILDRQVPPLGSNIIFILYVSYKKSVNLPPPGVSAFREYTYLGE